MNHFLFFKLYSLAHQSNFLDWLIVFCANNFGYIMVFIAVIFLIFHTDGVFDYRTPFLQMKNKIKEIFFVFFSGVFAWGLVTLLKSLILYPRPFILFDSVQPLFIHGGLESFPSGHAVFFSALAMSLFFIHKRIGFLYIFVAIIVGLARVASGVHFPLDIFIGYLIGVSVAVIFNFIFNKKNYH